MNCWSTTEFLEVAAVGLLPQHGAIAQNLRRHLRQPRREIGLEVVVLLVDRRELAGMCQGLPGKASEVAVLAHLGVVDESLAADPAKQRLRLRRCWVIPESIADLHTVIMHSV